MGDLKNFKLINYTQCSQNHTEMVIVNGFKQHLLEKGASLDINLSAEIDVTIRDRTVRHIDYSSTIISMSPTEETKDTEAYKNKDKLSLLDNGYVQKTFLPVSPDEKDNNADWKFRPYESAIFISERFFRKVSPETGKKIMNQYTSSFGEYCVNTRNPITVFNTEHKDQVMFTSIVPTNVEVEFDKTRFFNNSKIENYIEHRDEMKKQNIPGADEILSNKEHFLYNFWHSYTQPGVQEELEDIECFIFIFGEKLEPIMIPD